MTAVTSKGNGKSFSNWS